MLLMLRYAITLSHCHATFAIDMPSRHFFLPLAFLTAHGSLRRCAPCSLSFSLIAAVR